MKIAVVGLGGVGGFVGGALAKVEPKTCFLARGENLAAILKDGLTVESDRLGRFCVVPVLATDDARQIGVADAVILAVKGYDFEQSCRQIAPMVGPATVVLPLLNGVTVSQVMEPLLPPCILADGCINVFSHLAQPGRVRQEGKSCRIVLGMTSGKLPPELLTLGLELEHAGIPVEATRDIAQASWVKYTLMCGNSVALARFDVTAGDVQKDPQKLNFLRSAYGELVSVAEAMGVSMPEGLVEQYMSNFLALPPDTMTSLYRDLKNGRRKNELSHIVGRLVELAGQAGVPVPCHEAVLEQYRDFL